MLKQTRNSFKTKFQAQWKVCSSSYQVKKILAVFCDLIPLILRQSSVEVLGVTEIVKEIKFEGDWDKLEKKNVPETVTHKTSETNSSFHVK